MLPEPRAHEPGHKALQLLATMSKSKPKGFDDLLPGEGPGSGAGSARRNRRERLASLESREVTAGHPDGPYGSGSDTFGRYSNFSNAAHMLCRLVRLSSGNTQSVDWQLGLRGGQKKHPEEGWRRYFTRKQASFDHIARNCTPDNEAYQSRIGTPFDHSFDRHQGAMKTATIRDTPISFERAKGCEGAQAGQWQHIFHSRPAATRLQLQHLTSLREMPGQHAGMQISDNRSDTCWVEMMGKKRWERCRPPDPLERHPQEGGDAKLHHLYYLKVRPEPDEDARAQRTSKTPRLAQEKARRQLNEERRGALK
ncbi:unnamed protein product [Effrenium voratum]|nr:unnamed protein product [Effrenium voratum]